jgi:transcription initiation factor TFIID subunit 11
MVDKLRAMRDPNKASRSLPTMERTFIPANPSNARGRQRPASSSTGKRGRKPRSATLDSPLPTSPDVPSNPSAAPSATASPATTTPIQWTQPLATTPVAPVVAPAPVTPAVDVPIAGPSPATSGPPGQQRPIGAMEEEVEGEDELLPAMADDDYSAQLSWQSQSKDNLKCVPFLPISYYEVTDPTLF